MFDSRGQLNFTALRFNFDYYSSDEKFDILKALQCSVDPNDDPSAILEPCLENKTDQLGLHSSQHVSEFAEYHAHKWIQFYLPPVLIVIGVVGNLLSLLTLIRPTMRRTPAYLYLCVLSVADTLVLIVGLLRIWTEEITGYDIRTSSDVVCCLTGVIGSIVSDYAAWLITAMTVERFIAACYPLKAPSFVGRTRAVATMIIIAMVMFSFNAHFFWTVRISQPTNTGSDASHLTHDRSNEEGYEYSYTVGLEREEGQAEQTGEWESEEEREDKLEEEWHGNEERREDEQGSVIVSEVRCEAAAPYKVFVNKVWPWVDALIYSIIPFVVILVLNILIIRAVLQSRKTRKMLSTVQCAHNNRYHVCDKTSGTDTHRSSQPSSSNLDGGTKLTIMLLTVSFAFLLTTLPIIVVLVVNSFWKERALRDVRLGAKLMLAQTVGLMLMFVNHSTNFFLYCATGQKFRLQLRAVFTSSQCNSSQSTETSPCPHGTKQGGRGLGKRSGDVGGVAGNKKFGGAGGERSALTRTCPGGIEVAPVGSETVNNVTGCIPLGDIMTCK